MLSIFQQAIKGKYAIGAFNVSNLEGARAIIMAGQNLKSPVLISTSENEAKFIGLNQIRAIIDSFKKETNLPVVLHLDHGKSLEIIKKAVEAGYNSVHFDGSNLNFEENIQKTKEAVDFSRARGILNIEGELGYLRGQSAPNQVVEIREEDLTKPEQVEEFITKTGVDSLAVAIGNIHGIVVNGKERLFLERLKAIADITKDNVALVLHGGSGLMAEDIKKAIQLGIVKININTELRVAYINALKGFLAGNPDETTPYKILAPALEAIRRVVEEKIRLFGSEGRT